MKELLMKKTTIYFDENINSLIDIEARNKNISVNKLVNEVMAKYYKQKLKNDHSFLSTDEEQLLNDINRSLSKIQKLILYSNHLLNGGLPIFKTNTDTLILKPTENLKSEARKKTAMSYANFLKNEMSKEDYYSKGPDENDR